MWMVLLIRQVEYLSPGAGSRLPYINTDNR